MCSKISHPRLFCESILGHSELFGGRKERVKSPVTIKKLKAADRAKREAQVGKTSKCQCSQHLIGRQRKLESGDITALCPELDTYAKYYVAKSCLNIERCSRTD
jgi:hypothetical protein